MVTCCQQGKGRLFRYQMQGTSGSTSRRLATHGVVNACAVGSTPKGKELDLPCAVGLDSLHAPHPTFVFFSVCSDTCSSSSMSRASDTCAVPVRHSRTRVAMAQGQRPGSLESIPACQAAVQASAVSRPPFAVRTCQANQDRQCKPGGPSLTPPPPHTPTHLLLYLAPPCRHDDHVLNRPRLVRLHQADARHCQGGGKGVRGPGDSQSAGQLGTPRAGAGPLVAGGRSHSGQGGRPGRGCAALLRSRHSAGEPI